MIKLNEPIFMESCENIYVTRGGKGLTVTMTIMNNNDNELYLCTFKHTNVMSISLERGICMVIRASSVYNDI